MRWAARLAGACAFLAVFAAAAQNCPPVDAEAQKKAQAECAASGGEWSRFGVLDALCNVHRCAPRTADGGKPCRGHADCEHLCVYPKGGPIGAEVTGECTAVRTAFGCLTHVDGGGIAGRVCIE